MPGGGERSRPVPSLLSYLRPQLVGLACGVLAIACPGDGPTPSQRAPSPVARVERQSDAGSVEPSRLVFEESTERSARASGALWREGAIITGAAAQRLILFTFDDGPDRNTTPALLDVLDELGIRAVFFVTAEHLAGPGNRAAEQRELVEQMLARGHIVGNHTFHHEQLPLLDDRTALEEVLATERTLTPLLGERPWLIRVPGGSRSPRIDAMLAERGYTQVLWNLGTGDFQVRDAAEVVRTFRRVLARRERENAERGGIVLLHDLHPWSVEAVPGIVAHLRARNCELLAAGDELYDIVDDPTYFYAPRAADAGAGSEAPPARMPAEVHALRQEQLRNEARAHCDASSRAELDL